MIGSCQGRGVPRVKALTILSLVQTGLLILLFGRVVSLEDELAAQSPDEQTKFASYPFFPPPANDYSSQAYLPIDEDQLRRIIREELGAYSAVTANAEGHEPEASISNPATLAENQYQLDRVSEQIEYFASVGRISDADMQDLQTEIARLDKTDRTATLRKLTQALNSGAIDGRF